MTCAHVVDVALKKTVGVESVEVNLNQGRATVKLKPGNTVTVPQLWELIHQKGYTPKRTGVLARGVLSQPNGKLQFQVSGSSTILAVAVDPKAPAVLADALNKTVKIRGAMEPGKDFKAPVPLQLNQVERE